MRVSLDFKANMKLRELLNTGVKKELNHSIFRVVSAAQQDMKVEVNKSIYLTKGPGKPFRRTRKLAQSITAQMLMYAAGRVFVGVNYGKYVEEGTGIYGFKKKAFWTTFGGILDRPILYQGMAPRPFIKPVVDRYENTAADMIMADINKRIEV